MWNVEECCTYFESKFHVGVQILGRGIQDNIFATKKSCEYGTQKQSCTILKPIVDRHHIDVEMEEDEITLIW